MFIGHYAAGLVGKSVDRRLPLWHLFVAAQLVDFVWALLVLIGVEKVRIVAGFTAASPLDLYYFPFSHSLPAVTGLAIVATLAYRLVGSWRSALIIGGVVLSHWLADWLVHTPDLPLFADQHKVGLGIWDNLAASLIVEIGCMLGALLLYLRATEPTTPGGRYGMPLFVAAMVAMFVGGTLGKPPPSPTALAGVGLFSFVGFAAVAGWLDRKRA